MSVAGDPDRLFLRVPLPGIARVLGAVLLVPCSAAAADALAGRLGAFGVLFTGIGLFVAVTLLLGHKRLTLDRGRRLLLASYRAPWTLWTETVASGRFSAVVLSEETRTSGEGGQFVSTHYRVALRGSFEPLSIEEVGTWEEAMDLAEMLACFLEVPLEDQVRNERRRHHELDVPLVERREPSERRRLTGSPRARLEKRGDELHITIPRPGWKPFWTIAALLALILPFWTVPASLSGSPLLGLLPAALILAAALKVAFGFSARVVADRSGLRIATRGLLLSRRVELPAEEIEALFFQRPEWGGPKNMLVFTVDGFLIARSDRASVRFGHGLSRPELEWLAEQILQTLADGRSTSAHQRPGTLRPRSYPEARGWAPEIAALSIFGLASSLIGPPLSVGPAIPFLEHVLNVGGVIGAALARKVRLETRAAGQRRRGGRVVRWLVALALVVLVSSPALPFFQAAPTFDDRALLQARPSFTSDGAAWQASLPALRFWVGWLAITQAAGVLGLWAVFGIGRLLWRLLRPRGASQLAASSPPRTASGHGPVSRRWARGPLRVGWFALAGLCAGIWLIGWRHHADPLGEASLRQLSSPAPLISRRWAPPPLGSLAEIVHSARGRPLLLYFAELHGWRAGDVVEIDRLAAEHSDHGLLVLGLPVDLEGSELKAFAERERVGFPLLSGAALNRSRLFAGSRVPHAALYDPAGQLVWRGMPDGRLDSELEKLLGPGRPRAARPTLTARGELWYAGERWCADGHVGSLTLTDTWRYRPGPRVSVRPHEGELVVADLAPGRYRIHGYLRRQETSFVAFLEQDFLPSRAAEPFRLVLMHLLELVHPVATTRFSEPLMLEPAPVVRFEWKGVPEATGYRWSLVRDAAEAERLEGRSTDPWAEVSVRPAASYRFEAEAWRGEELIGHLRTIVGNQGLLGLGFHTGE